MGKGKLKCGRVCLLSLRTLEADLGDNATLMSLLETRVCFCFCSEMHKKHPFHCGASGENRQVEEHVTSSTVALGAPGGPAAWQLLGVMWLATLNTTAVITVRERGKEGKDREK